MIDLLIVILISAVAAARVLRLLTVDDLTWRLRNVVGRAPALVRDWYECPWCSGAWYSAAFVVTGLWATDSLTWWGAVAGSLAASYLTARIVASEDE